MKPAAVTSMRLVNAPDGEWYVASTDLMVWFLNMADEALDGCDRPVGEGACEGHTLMARTFRHAARMLNLGMPE